MYRYTVLVESDFVDKFENFIKNLNLVNSKKVASISSKDEIVAVPKEYA